MNLKHAMIDLETMGTTPGAAIVSIGVVIFDPRFGKVDKENTFYRELDWQTQKRHIDNETWKWWGRQSDLAKGGLHGLEDLDDVLVELIDFLPSDVKVWGNGATFDISMLEDAYRQFNTDCPWKFYNVRDCRTIKDIYESSRGGLNKTMGSVVGSGAHNALNDALHQAEYITFIWNKILSVGNQKTIVPPSNP